MNPDPLTAPPGLLYVSDEVDGIRRVRHRYVDPAGRPVRDRVQLRRIRSLGIPPAYDKVWICPGQTAICKPPGAMPAAASNTSTSTRRATARTA